MPVDGEPGGGDSGGGDDDGDDDHVEASPRVHGARMWAPLGLSGAPPSTADATFFWNMDPCMFQTVLDRLN